MSIHVVVKAYGVHATATAKCFVVFLSPFLLFFLVEINY